MKNTNTIRIAAREQLSKGGIKALRREGNLPASVSIRGEDAASISLKRDELTRAIAKHGLSAVYKLTLDGKKVAYNAMVKEIQYAPVTRECLHVTFQQVSLTENTTAQVTIRILERDSVTYKGLELLQHETSMAVTGLPNDIPEVIELDVSEMEAGDQIQIKDVKLPKGTHAEDDPERLILNVSFPRVQEEEAAEEAGEAAEGEEAVATEAAAEDSAEA